MWNMVKETGKLTPVEVCAFSSAVFSSQVMAVNSSTKVKLSLMMKLSNRMLSVMDQSSRPTACCMHKRRGHKKKKKREKKEKKKKRKRRQNWVSDSMKKQKQQEGFIKYLKQLILIISFYAISLWCKIQIDTKRGRGKPIKQWMARNEYRMDWKTCYTKGKLQKLCQGIYVSDQIKRQDCFGKIKLTY